MKKLIILSLFVPVLVHAQVSFVTRWKVKPDSKGVSCENGEISPDKRYVAAGNSQGGLKIYNFSDGSLVTELDYYKQYNPTVSKDGEIESCYFSFDSKFIAAGGNNHGVKVWEVGTWRLVKYFSGGVCDGMAFSPNNQWFAAPSKGTVNIYRISDWTKIATVTHGCDVNSIDFSADSKYMLTGACDKKVIITNTSNWSTYKSISFPASVKSVRLSPDGRYFATANSNGFQTNVMTFPDGVKVKTIIHGSSDPYYQESVEWTADNQYLLTGGDNNPGKIKFYRRSDWSLAASFNIHATGSRCEYIARVDDYFLSAGGDGYAVLLKYTPGTPTPLPPSVNITSPANNSSFESGNCIPVTASATDADGTITKIELYADNVKIAEGSSSTLSYNWCNAVTGSHQLSAKAYDNSNRSTTSAIITVKVNNTSIYYPIPGKVEAENYSAMMGIQTQATTDAGGGLNIGYVSAGDWLDYRITVAAAGEYTINLRVASAKTTGKIDIRSGSTTLASVTVPNTGGWQTWQTITTKVTLSAGQQVLRLYASGAEWNLNWFEGIAIVPPPAPQPTTYYTIPGIVEAENYFAMTGVKTETTTDIGGGLNVGYISVGDWMDYAIDVAATGDYNISLRVASLKTTGKIEIRSGSAVLASLTVPNTGGWQTWININAAIPLQQGQQILRLYATGQEWNINKFEMNPTDGLKTLTAIEQVQSQSVRIYPNPCKNILQIDGLTTETTITIIDTDGRVWIQQPADKNTQSIAMGHLNPGIYLIQITDGTTIKTLNVIKQ